MTLYSVKLPPSETLTATVNRYILETETTLYHYCCPTMNTSVGTLQAGNYIIDMALKCVLDGGLPIVNYNQTQNIPSPRAIDVNWLNFTYIPFQKHALNLRVQKLSFPNYEAINKPPVSKIVSEIYQIGKTRPIWWCLPIIAIALAAVVVALVYFVYSRYIFYVRNRNGHFR